MRSPYADPAFPLDTIDGAKSGVFARLSPHGDRLAVVAGNTVRLFHLAGAR